MNAHFVLVLVGALLLIVSAFEGVQRALSPLDLFKLGLGLIALSLVV